MTLVERLAKKREQFNAAQTNLGRTWSYVHEADWWLNAIADELESAGRRLSELPTSGEAAAAWLRRKASE